MKKRYFFDAIVKIFVTLQPDSTKHTFINKNKFAMASFDEILIETYKEQIASYATHSENKEFYNSGEKHAIVVLNSIVNTAQKYINIYCGNMCTEVNNNDEYLANIRNFLSEGKSLNIILCDTGEDDKCFRASKIFSVIKEFPTNVCIKTTQKKVVGDENNPMHFTVADDIIYRLETDIINKKAKGNFNDRDTVKHLNNLFQQILNDPSSTQMLLS